MSAATTRDTNQTNHPNGNSNGDGPRRSSLVQERSRRTRRELVNAAVKLWTEHGFENGVETTTVEEIARAAGVTKGTFYFHFAHKEDVLLEMSNAAGDAAMEVARRSAEEGSSIDEIIQRAFAETARRTERMPRAAIARTLAEFYKHPTRSRDHNVTREVFPDLFQSAQQRGDSRRRGPDRGGRDAECTHDHRGRGVGPRRVPGSHPCWRTERGSSSPGSERCASRDAALRT